MAPIRTALLVALTLTIAGAASAQLPVIDSLEVSTVPVSGRLTVMGSNFEQTGQIHVCGLEALVVPIEGTNSIEMDAYVPETTPFGPCDVTVTTSVGTSNAVTLEVTPRIPVGRELWRFIMNAQTMIHRPAIGADGTIYAKSAAGDLVALSPDGELLWFLQLESDVTPTIDIGPEGTIYTAEDGPRVVAVNPDGTIKWTYADTPSQGVLAGPNVGPDGNLYVVTHIPGTGVLSLDPTGNLRWTGPDSTYGPIGQVGQEIVFSATQLFFCQDGLFDSFDFDGTHMFRQTTITAFSSNSPQPAVGPNGDSYIQEWGRLRSHDASGNLNWIAFDVGGTSLRDPDVGPDGTIYVHRNVFNTLHALNPDGSEKWGYSHEDSTLSAVVNPTGDKLVMGGAGATDGAGFILALDTDGNPLWQHNLPLEQFGFDTIALTPQGRPRFSDDGSVAYVMVLGPARHPGHSYLYAIQVEPIADVGHALAGTAGAPQLTASGEVGAGSTVSLSLTNAQPKARVFIIAGQSTSGRQFRGGVMLPRRESVVRLRTNAAGELDHDLTLPANWPSGSTYYAQVWVQDPSGPQGMAASNALSLIAP